MKIFLQVLLATGTAAAAIGEQYVHCAAATPPTAERAKKIALMAEEAKNLEARAAEPTIFINTYAHVVETAAEAGNVSDYLVRSQILVMNQAYADAGFRFLLKDISHTVNELWANTADGSHAEFVMKSKLREGDYYDFNIYFLSHPRNGEIKTGGWATFPKFQPTQRELYLDGAICSIDTMPGNAPNDYHNEGKTSVHEAGHWLDLYHPFEGYACTGPNDDVADTPIQSSYSTGCPSEKDTCPEPGVDNIHNYMEYTSDACRTLFTPGQVQFMRNSWYTFRTTH